MINGAHVILYSTDAEKDKGFFRDVLKFGHVDVGHGWLIFELPPAEMAVHPSDENDLHELYLMCDDLDAEMARLKKAGVPCEAPSQQRWGNVTHLTPPGGGRIGLYQPRHAQP
jgi:catechol 2,3-dioxygenase-like lactoylglutathione lyase family enzyme